MAFIFAPFAQYRSVLKDHSSMFSIEKMCKTLKVSKSSYYCWLKRKPNKRDIENIYLAKRIRKIYDDSKKTYGSPRIIMALRSEGIIISRRRITMLIKK